MNGTNSGGRGGGRTNWRGGGGGRHNNQRGGGHGRNQDRGGKGGRFGGRGYNKHNKKYQDYKQSENCRICIGYTSSLIDNKPCSNPNCTFKHCMLETDFQIVRQNVKYVSAIGYRNVNNINTIFAACSDGSLTQYTLNTENWYNLQTPEDIIPQMMQLPFATTEDVKKDIGITAMEITPSSAFIVLGYLGNLFSAAPNNDTSLQISQLINKAVGGLTLLSDDLKIDLVISETEMYADEVRVNDIAMIEMEEILYVFVAGESGKTRQWQIEKSVQNDIYGVNLTFEGNMAGISSICAAQAQDGGAYVFTGGKDSMIRVYDAGTAELYYTICLSGVWLPSQPPPPIEMQGVQDLVGHFQMVSTLTVISVFGIDILISGGYDNLLKCWTMDGNLIHTQKYSHKTNEIYMKINCIVPMQTDQGMFLLVGHGQSKASLYDKNSKPLPGYGLTILEVIEDNSNLVSFHLRGEYNKQNREVTKIVVLDDSYFVLSYGDGTVGVYGIDNFQVLKGS